MATELEKQIAELMSGVASIDESAKKAKADGARVRRKSRELDNVFSSIDSMKPAEKLTSLMRRRRGSRDFDDAFLLEAFNELDIDGSGKLNRDELKQACRSSQAMHLLSSLSLGQTHSISHTPSLKSGHHARFWPARSHIHVHLFQCWYLQAIEKVDPNASMNAVTEMIDFADKNKDGQIDFEEFKKAVTTKPDTEAAGASTSAAPSK